MELSWISPLAPLRPPESVILHSGIGRKCGRGGAWRALQTENRALGEWKERQIEGKILFFGRPRQIIVPQQ